MKLGIQFRLGLLLAAFGVLATGLTGLYSFLQSRESLLSAAERNLLAATQVFGRRLNHVVGDVANDVRLLGELELTRRIAKAADAPEADKGFGRVCFHFGPV